MVQISGMDETELAGEVRQAETFVIPAEVDPDGESKCPTL